MICHDCWTSVLCQRSSWAWDTTCILSKTATGTDHLWFCFWLKQLDYGLAERLSCLSCKLSLRCWKNLVILFGAPTLRLLLEGAAAMYCGLLHTSELPAMTHWQILLSFATYYTSRMYLRNSWMEASMLCCLYTSRMYLKWSTDGGYCAALPRPTSDAPLAKASMYRRHLLISEIPSMIHWRGILSIATS